MGQHETAGMLAEMARRAHELPGEIERQAKAAIGDRLAALADEAPAGGQRAAR